MQVTVLGKSRAWQGAAGACSGDPVHPARPQLYAPGGATATLRKIVGCWGGDDLIDNASV